VLPDSLRRVIQLLGRFPGVGEKTAQRFALRLMVDPDLAQELSRELLLAEVAEDGAICRICRDPRRDAQVLCIVARVQDLLAIERSGAMRGRYFVLGKLLSPLDGIGPDELPLEALNKRLLANQTKEVILATPPSVDGEATALLLARELSTRGISVSRIASGVPHGGDLEFADQITLGRAIDGRRRVDE
jgi:recombination protein RecR